MQLKSIRVRPMFLHLTEEGLLKVSGKDTKKLLQGQLTCNIDKISGTESSMGAHCNPQGRVIFLFYLFQWHDAYYLLMPRNMIPIAIAALKKYAVFYKVELSDASDEMIIIGYKGDAAILDRYPIHLRIPAGSSRFRLLMTNTIPASPTFTIDEWKCLEIDDKIPAIYPESSGKFLPHEINLPQLNAVDFEKGCYTGQEIIARMHYRGKLKKHMYLAHLSTLSLPLPGMDIPDKGMVVDACKDADHYKALIVGEEKKE